MIKKKQTPKWIIFIPISRSVTLFYSFIQAKPFSSFEDKQLCPLTNVNHYELEYVHGLIVEDAIKYEADEVEAYVLYYVEPDGTEWEITEEEYIRLRGDFSADEIINELVKAKQ